jgi:hypothetical protein
LLRNLTQRGYARWLRFSKNCRATEEEDRLVINHFVKTRTTRMLKMTKKSAFETTGTVFKN